MTYEDLEVELVVYKNIVNKIRLALQEKDYDGPYSSYECLGKISAYVSNEYIDMDIRSYSFKRKDTL